MQKTIIKDAFIKTLPILVSYMVLGFGFGILLRTAGYGLLWAMAMSIFIYAGSMQFVGVSLITGPATIVMTILTTIMVNARHLFYSISMIKKYQDAGKIKPYLAFALTDETYAVLSNEDYKDQDNQYLFYFLVSIFNQSYWVIGTMLGSIFHQVLPFNTAGIEFSMTALFIAAFTEGWVRGKNRVPAILGLTITLACRLVFGQEIFLIPAMLIITMALIILRPKLEVTYE